MMRMRVLMRMVRVSRFVVFVCGGLMEGGSETAYDVWWVKDSARREFIGEKAEHAQ